MQFAAGKSNVPYPYSGVGTGRRTRNLVTVLASRTTQTTSSTAIPARRTV
ncbi:MAG: hypothetical protein IKS21_00290 [Oscillospiraceae bacterium]|nr:hypothetical protein [Oscillospiraceae bacterium]